MIYNKTNFRIHALTEKSRYYLDGLHVTPEYTEVTNGHYLIRVSTPEGKVEDLPKANGHEPVKGNFEFILPSVTAKEVEQSIPNVRTLPILNNSWIVEDTEDEVTFITTDLNTTKPITTRKIEGKFPRTDAIFPKDDPSITIGFDPDYMMKICQQYKKAEIKQVTLSLYGLTKTMKLDGKNVEKDQTITTLLMPVKMDKEKWNEED